VVRKQGLRHTRRDTATGAECEVLLLGGACSEVFTGPRLAKVLTPAFELQKRTMDALAAGQPAPPLSNHTCNGVSPHLFRACFWNASLDRNEHYTRVYSVFLFSFEAIKLSSYI